MCPQRHRRCKGQFLECSCMMRWFHMEHRWTMESRSRRNTLATPSADTKKVCKLSCPGSCSGPTQRSHFYWLRLGHVHNPHFSWEGRDKPIHLTSIGHTLRTVVESKPPLVWLQCASSSSPPQPPRLASKSGSII